MLVLLDTGILLRLLDRADPQHSAIRQALRTLRARGDDLVASPQNVAEFWNVCTRPATARGGFGLSLQETDRRLRLIERLFRVLPDSPATYPLWRQLAVQHGVQGVQVHGITHLLTLNAGDFTRYPSIIAWTPQDAQALPPPP